MPNTSINTVDAKEEFTELVNRVVHNKERIILTRRGNDIAAIVPIEDLALLMSAQQKADLEEAANALKEAREQGTMSLDDFKEELG